MLDKQVVLPPSPHRDAVATRSLLANLTVLALSVGLIVITFRLLQERFTTVVSRDAVINGTLVNLNAPIEGTVSKLTLTTGSPVLSNQILLALNHPIARSLPSQMPLQAINTRIADLQARLTQARLQLNQTLALQTTWSGETAQQQSLEIQDAQQTIVQVESELQAMESRYRLADSTYQRQVVLHQEGAIARAALDVATENRDTLGHQVKTLEARLTSTRNQSKASELGLSLTRERSNYSPRLRLQDLEVQAETQKQELIVLEQSLQSAQSELTQVRLDLNNQKTDLKQMQKQTVIASIAGVIWDLNAKQGQFVQKGATLGQVLDCRRRWVDVYVEEEALRSIRPGSAAKIELFGSSTQTLNGKVSLIRSGIGRLQAGQEISAVPISPNLPRTTQVRVDLDPSTPQGSPEVMCYVGYTAKVSFPITR